MKEKNTMNTNSKRLGIYMLLMLIGTSVATALRTVACIGHLDYSTGYFTEKSLIPVANAVIIATVILMLGYPIIASKVKLRASFSTSATYIPSGILAVAVFFAGVRALSYAMSIAAYPIRSLKTPINPSAIIGALVFVFSLATVAYLFFNTYFTDAKSDVRAYLAIGAIAFFALYAMLTYLDGSLSTNSHGKLVNQMAFLFAAIFFLYEVRISIGREMWRAYATFGLMAAALSAYASIPTIITYYVKDTLIYAPAGARSVSSLEGCMVLLLLFIFIISRLALTATLAEEKENKLIKAMSEYAERREERVDESFARHQDVFAAKQLSIFEISGVETPPEISEDERDTEDATPTHEEPDAVTISDDAIYESIFGKMPERPEADEHEAEPEEPEEEKDPEEVADEILSAVDKAMKEEKDNKDE